MQMNIPEWFNEDIAKKIMGDDYDKAYKKCEEDMFLESHDRAIALQRTDRTMKVYAYGYFMAMAQVCLERQERYPTDNPLLSRLSDITGLSRTEILNIAERKQNENDHLSAYDALQKAIQNLDEKSLVHLWNACAKISLDPKQKIIYSTDEIPLVTSNTLGELFYTYGNLFLKDAWTISKTPVSKYMLQADNGQYYPLRNLSEYIDVWWMIAQILAFEIDVSAYPTVLDALKKYINSEEYKHK